VLGLGGAVESYSGMFNIYIADIIECAFKNSLYALLVGKRTVPALLFADDADISFFLLSVFRRR